MINIMLFLQYWLYLQIFTKYLSFRWWVWNLITLNFKQSAQAEQPSWCSQRHRQRDSVLCAMNIDGLFESITLLWLRNYLVNCDFKRHVLFDGTSIFFFSLQIFIRAIWKSANHPCYLPMPRYLPTFILPIRLRFAIMHSADTNSKSKIVQ